MNLLVQTLAKGNLLARKELRSKAVPHFYSPLKMFQLLQKVRAVTAYFSKKEGSTTSVTEIQRDKVLKQKVPDSQTNGDTMLRCAKPYFRSRKGLLIVTSAVLFVFALGLVQFYLAWICLIPLFVAIQKDKGKKAFISGALFGFVFGSLTLYWLTLAVFSITNGSLGKSIFSGLIVSGVFTLYYGVMMWWFSWIKRDIRSIGLQAVLMASFWTAGELLLSKAFVGMPWFLVNIGNTLLGNLYAIQPAEYGGIHLLNFFVVFVNYLFASYLIRRQWKKMIIPAGWISLYMIVGYFTLYHFKQHSITSGQPITIALLNGSIPDGTHWDETNGNTLVNGLLDLNQEALQSKPDFVLWPESVVPWTYTPEDDFIKAVFKATTSSPGTYHIIGLNTYVTATEWYNSAYCLSPDGSVAGRHDKHYLVSMAESPITLLSSMSKKDQGGSFRAGALGSTIVTEKGKFGMLICNEVSVPGVASALVKKGAEFLVSLSSDALFAPAAGAVNQQFFRNRLRAIESRKDIAVCCNMGISGMISAGGEILFSKKSNEGFTQNVVLQPNRYLPPSYHLGLGLLGISILLILFFSLLTFKLK